MQIRRFHDVAAYAAAAEPFLLRHEAINCFFLGQIAQLSSPTDALLLVAHDTGGDPVAVATMTPGRHMMMTAAPPAAVDAVVAYLLEHGIGVPGIGGPPDVSERFTALWCAATNATSRVHVRFATFELTIVTPPPPAPGAMRPAALADLDLLASWVQAFREAIGEAFLGGARQLAEERIRNREMFLWHVDGQPVAMGGAIGPTRNGIRIVLVYTPPEHRKRGYASNLVATLTQHQLDAGRRFCFLTTDLTNPTSNKIYREIGYRPVSESVTLLFDRVADAR